MRIRLGCVRVRWCLRSLWGAVATQPRSQMRGQPRLTPCRRAAASGVDGNGPVGADVEQDVTDRVQMVEHDPVLDDHVRFGSRLRLQAEVAEDGAGVDPAVDAQQRHSDVVTIGVRKRPEAAVRIPIFGTDARMHHESPEPGDREDLFLQKGLAPRDDEVRALIPDETLRVGVVRRRHDDLRSVGPCREQRTQAAKGARRPTAVAARTGERIEVARFSRFQIGAK